jgi:hypothetical protein
VATSKEQVEEIKREQSRGWDALRRITKSAVTANRRKGIWKPEKLRLSKHIALAMNLNSTDF